MGNAVRKRSPKAPEEKWLWLEQRAVAAEGSECVLWPWGLTSAGYGSISCGGRSRLISHLILEMSGSSRPDFPRNHALHSCDVRTCGNRSHLSWGTNAENIRQKMLRGRSKVGPVGVAHHNAKLNPEKVRQVRTLLAGGLPLDAVAERFQVSRPAIARIRDGRAWKHVT